MSSIWVIVLWSRTRAKSLTQPVGLEIFDRLSGRGDCERQNHTRSETKSHAQGHRKIVQEYGEAIAKCGLPARAIRDGKIAMCDSRITGLLLLKYYE
jgi:hypothetical protein